MMPRPPRVIAALALSCALVGAATAAAQDSGQEPAAPGTATLGPFRITPSVVLADLGVDNNVKNESVNPKSDFTFTLSPRADVKFRMRRLLLDYVTSTDYVYYAKYRTERSANTSSSGRIDFDLGRLRPYATVQGVSTRARLNAEVDERARHHDRVYGGGVRFKVASRTTVVVNGLQSKIVYEPDEEFRGVRLDRSFNGRLRVVDVGLAIALTPLTTLTVPIAREQQRFSLSPERDSNTWRITPTFTFSPVGLVTGSALFGYRHFAPVSPTLPGFSGFVSRVTVGATIYSSHQVQALFSRDVQYSYDARSTYYVATGGALTWTYLLGGPIDVRGTAGRYLMNYDKTGGGSDTTTSYGGGVGYRFSNRARLGLNVNWMRRDSGIAADRAFRNHRIFAGLTWGTS